MIRREDVWPLGVLAFLLVTTAAWWALALWPMPPETHGWLLRAREVCFNTGPTGLPDRSGWILLIGEPIGMLAVLMVVWGAEVRQSLARLVSSLPGRAAAFAVMGLVALGLGAAVTRVAAARVPDVELAVADLPPETYPRLDRAWPEAPGLVDQRGEPFTFASLEGRPALVTFAFAHCATICPLLVKSALEARAELRGEVALAVVAITLDPWRDTPSRLPGMAARWGLEEGDFVLSGAVEAVEAALDAWNVPRERDERTGELAHPALTFLVEGDGTVAYATAGSPVQLAALGRRLRDAGGTHGRR
jgi:cytochrome oxidase Cu insertion factor (SCO1/SenC/PrrC family)